MPQANEHARRPKRRNPESQLNERERILEDKSDNALLTERLKEKPLISHDEVLKRLRHVRVGR